MNGETAKQNLTLQTITCNAQPMSMLYARVFLQILDSSLAENMDARHLFEDLLKLVDSDGVVDMTHGAIARRINATEQWVRDGIAYLESPDPKSRNPAFEGRRLLRLSEHRDWGWRIANWQEYEKVRNRVDQIEANRRRVAEFRNKKRVEDSTLPPAPPSGNQNQPQIHTQSVTQRSLQGITGNDETPRNAPVTDDEADQLYQLYPRHQAKGAALKAIKKAGNLAPFSLLKERVKAYSDAVSSWPKESNEFIPLASTWFNQQRWEDDPKTWERTAPVSNVPPWKRREILQSQIDELSPKVNRMPDGPERVSEHKRLTAMHEELAKIQ